MNKNHNRKKNHYKCKGKERVWRSWSWYNTSLIIIKKKSWLESLTGSPLLPALPGKPGSPGKPYNNITTQMITEHRLLSLYKYWFWPFVIWKKEANVYELEKTASLADGRTTDGRMDGMTNRLAVWLASWRTDGRLDRWTDRQIVNEHIWNIIYLNCGERY